MSDFPDGIVIEARKAGLKQAKRKDKTGEWVDFHDITFEMHPNDTTTPLSNMPLGTRVYLVVTVAAEADSGVAQTEETITPQQIGAEAIAQIEGQRNTEQAPKGGPICKRAVMLCKRAEFQHWQSARAWQLWQKDVQMGESEAAECLRGNCNIESRAELDHNTEAALIFEQIAHDFYEAQHGETTEAFEVMKGEGPG